MKVDSILKAKGRRVVTAPAHTTVAAAARKLAEARIGAIIVSDDGARVAGIVSERDIVRLLAEGGGAALTRPLSEVMARRFVTCTRDDSVKQLMAVMTRRRVRHIPVVENDRLVGIVSIGDLVKSRLDEVELEANVLRDVCIALH